ncbi:MAG: hypothetical protein J0L82_12635 [Deltaproteobacteria bacterium]|jgi:hypothetical protein|nr:hypothetical protein [Deltaproteobacteria bacterium]
MLRLRRSVVYCSLVFCVSVGSTEAMADDPPGKYLFGHDFELSSQHLANIVPHFDLQRLESRFRAEPDLWKQVMTEKILDEYITYPNSLETIPSELRARLTKDLNLSLNLINHEALPIQVPKIVSSPQYVLPKAESTGVKVREQGLAKAEPTAVPTKRALETRANGLLVPIGSDWQELARRWRDLPIEEKREVARFDRLPNRVIADIIETKIQVPVKSTTQLEAYLQPKADAPEWMSRVTYSLDGRDRESSPGARQSVEIALRSPVSSKEDFFRHLDEVAKTTGLKTELDSPQLMKRSSAATHIHFSVSDLDEKPMEKVMHAWRRLVMVRLLDAGEQYDSVLEEPIGIRGKWLQNIYDLDLNRHHSLVRKVNWNHYELKEHAGNVKEELSEVLDLLAIDEKQAIQKMAQEVARTTARNPSILARIKRINPHVLQDFRELVSRDEFENGIEQLLRSRLVSDPTIIPFLRYADRPPSEEVWSVFERLLRNPPSAVVAHGVDYVVFNWNLYPAHPIADKYLRFFLAHPEK